jgi:hypothetical protein
LIPPTEN